MKAFFPISASLRELRGKSLFAFLTYCSVSFVFAAFAHCEEIDFETQVAPILIQNCLQCHNPAKARAGLDLSTQELARKGSDGGEVLIPGKPKESLLIKRADDGSMPPETDGRRLTAEEVAILAAWVKEGAKWPEGLVLRPAAALGGTPTAWRGRDHFPTENFNRQSLVGRILQHFRSRRNLSPAE